MWCQSDSKLSPFLLYGASFPSYKGFLFFVYPESHRWAYMDLLSKAATFYNPRKPLIWSGHVIHENDPWINSYLIVVFPDLQIHPDQRQSCQSLGAGSHHAQPQEATYIDILYIKMILRTSQK